MDDGRHVAGPIIMPFRQAMLQAKWKQLSQSVLFFSFPPRSAQGGPPIGQCLSGRSIWHGWYVGGEVALVPSEQALRLLETGSVTSQTNHLSRKARTTSSATGKTVSAALSECLNMSETKPLSQADPDAAGSKAPLGLTVSPLPGIGEIAPGDDLAPVLLAAMARIGVEPARSDVLIVTQKIVSKAEGRMVELATVTPSRQALELADQVGKDARLVELVLRESVAVVRAMPGVLITRDLHGLVMANAGIDQSNLGPEAAASPGEERALLLPRDPDASAMRLRQSLGTNATTPAVVISDSFGRPWRMGVTHVAIGASGLPSLIDRRGETDRDGRVMLVTQIALADMLACAAGIVAGEGNEGIPAVLIRGLRWSAGDRPASDLVRPVHKDLFL